MRKLNKYELQAIIKDNLDRLNTINKRETWKADFCFKQIEKAKKKLADLGEET